MAQRQSDLLTRLAALVLACALILAAPAGGVADETGWQALRAPGTHILMRHAMAPGVGDPVGFRLDAGGRAQAARIGASVAGKGIGFDHVLTSEWCRARETATLLGLAPVEAEPALNSFFDDRASAGAASRAVRDRLAAAGPDEKLVLVTHQVNITALTGIFPASGEMIVVALAADGALVVRGRIGLD
jgi:phosphohistidine phosphatase SixA